MYATRDATCDSCTDAADGNTAVSGTAKLSQTLAVTGLSNLDGGIAAADQFVRRYWTPLAEEDQTPRKDAKTSVQEWAQGRGLALPEYETLERTGPDHEPIFHIQVSVTGEAPATGEGPSKRAAEQAAAENLLTRLAGKVGTP